MRALSFFASDAGTGDTHDSGGTLEGEDSGDAVRGGWCCCWPYCCWCWYCEDWDDDCDWLEWPWLWLWLWLCVCSGEGCDCDCLIRRPPLLVLLVEGRGGGGCGGGEMVEMWPMEVTTDSSRLW